MYVFSLAGQPLCNSRISLSFSYLINSLLELGQSIDYTFPSIMSVCQPCSPLNSTDKLHP